jgi:RNA polymerase sigma-70 factor, ECF subfamily
MTTDTAVRFAAAARASRARDERGVSDAGEVQTSLVVEAVRRAKVGDREALGFLYVRYADNVYAYVRRIVHDSHEAEDVTQQVFAKLMSAIAQYEEREVPFFAWIMRVARNLAIDHIRRQRSVPVEEIYGTEGEREVRGKELTHDIREALSTLPVDQREVLVLRHLAGFSPPEIARLTGRSEGSIHGLHHRGRRALRLELTDRGAAPTTVASRAPSRLLARSGAVAPACARVA